MVTMNRAIRGNSGITMNTDLTMWDVRRLTHLDLALYTTSALVSLQLSYPLEMLPSVAARGIQTVIVLRIVCMHCSLIKYCAQNINNQNFISVCMVEEGHST